jgi:hypothetical protein
LGGNANVNPAAIRPNVDTTRILAVAAHDRGLIADGQLRVANLGPAGAEVIAAEDTNGFAVFDFAIEKQGGLLAPAEGPAEGEQECGLYCLDALEGRPAVYGMKETILFEAKPD